MVKSAYEVPRGKAGDSVVGGLESVYPAVIICGQEA
jgi:hypothetical protein